MKRIAVASIVIASIVAGCGSGGSDSGSTATSAAVPAATVARQEREAEGVCSKMAVAATHLGTKAHAVDPTSFESSLEYTTEALIAPSQPVVERAARELRAILGSQADSNLTAYVNLFDPIAALIEDRVRAGRANNSQEAHEIELELLELSRIQQTLAKEAKLKSCQVDLIGAFGAHTAG
jgi:hypothetical protein